MQLCDLTYAEFATVNLLSSGNSWANGVHTVPHPEAAWMLRQLLQYTYSRPISKAKMSFSIEHCTGCWPPIQAVLKAPNKTVAARLATDDGLA